MAAFYSVIQFVPDPVANERINAGIVVFDAKRVRAQFVRDWGRLQRFGNKDVGFLKSFAEDFADRCRATLFTDGQITGDVVRRVAATWQNSIQLTEPRGSLLDFDALLKDTEARFLASGKPVTPRPYTKHHMRSFAFQAASLAFLHKGGTAARQLVHQRFEIAGGVEPHRFSLAIANGRPFLAAEVFSFVGIDHQSQQKDLRASAWAFDDVRKRLPDLPLAALVLRAEPPTQVFREAERIFDSLGVEVVPKDAVAGWAEGVAGRVIADHSAA